MDLSRLIRPVPSWPWVFAKPSEPAWDAFGHTVLCAFARLRELESAPRISGGKAGSAQVRERIEARRRADDLLAEWVRRLDGRPGDGGSMTEVQVARDSARNKTVQIVNERNS